MVCSPGRGDLKYKQDIPGEHPRGRDTRAPKSIRFLKYTYTKVPIKLSEYSDQNTRVRSSIPKQVRSLYVSLRIEGQTVSFVSYPARTLVESER